MFQLILKDRKKKVISDQSGFSTGKGMSYHISWFKAPNDRKEIWSESIIDKDVEAVHHFVGLADFDMDGTLDVATAEMLQGEDPDEVKIYYNGGSGSSWEKQVLSDSGSQFSGLFTEILTCKGAGTRIISDTITCFIELGINNILQCNHAIILSKI